MIERINGVIEVDCLKCKNCDLENDRCKLYGSDPKKAAERCAANYFRGYRKKAEHGE
jgi:hypothetical protein